MVLVMELPNAFWGVTVNEGKRYTQKLTGAIHVSMAALEPGSNKGDDGPVSVMIQHDKADFMLCSLSSAQVFQQTLDLNFNEGEEVTFYLKGKGVVHLTGYVLTGDQYDSDSDDEDFMPGNSFVESDDSSSSDDDNGGGDMSGGSKKRKMPIMDKKSKKPKVEIVDDDEDDDDEEEEDSDMDDDDDDEEESPKKKKADKKKHGQLKKHQSAPSRLETEKKEKHKDKRAAESTSASKAESTSIETGEKKKRKRKKNKNKKNESENTTQASAGSSNEKGPSKPSPKVIEGVAIEDLKVGHGPEAKAGSTVHVYYTGRLNNGKLFDSKNSGKPAKFRLGKKEIIKGWDVGLQGMKVGGRRKLVIPANMGYGSQNVGTIPPNSTLQFEVELKAVN